MPQLNPNNSFTAADVDEIKAVLPRFDVSCAFKSNQQSGCINRYLDAYGFGALSDFDHYAFGFMQLENYRVAAHYWHSDEAAGCVVIAHGLFDHVGLYLDLVQALINKGFNVFAMDFPGHGLSDGEPGVIRSFDQYTRALNGALAQLKAYLPQPLYAVGQSTGGAVLLNYLLVEQGRGFDKVVLLAPLIRPRAWTTISVAYAILSPFLRFVRRTFTANSHLEGFSDFLAHHDPLQPRYISVEWIGAMKQWIQRFDKLPSSDVPVLVVQGDGDLTVDWRTNLPKIENKFSAYQARLIPDAKHHLVKEADPWQSQIFTATLEFLEK